MKTNLFNRIGEFQREEDLKSIVVKDNLKFFTASPSTNKPKTINVQVLKTSKEAYDNLPVCSPDNLMQCTEQSTQTDLYLSERSSKASNKNFYKNVKLNNRTNSRQELNILNASKQHELMHGENNSSRRNISKASEWVDWLQREKCMEETQAMRLELTEQLLKKRGSIHANDSTDVIEKSLIQISRPYNKNIAAIK